MTICGEQDCPDAFIDGFCDICGKPDVPTAGPTVIVSAPRVRSVTSSALPTITRVSRSYMEVARKMRSSVSVRKVSAGPMWPLPSCPVLPTPESMVMDKPCLPAGKATCGQCDKPVDLSGRFCDACGAEHAFKPALRAGDLVADQYRVAGCLAYGGMGWIYLAEDIRLERRVVLKGVLNGKDEGAAAAAILEKRHLSAMRHPTIVSIQDFVHHNERTYIVMEYVEGVSLKTLKAEYGPLRIHEALGCLLYLLPALGALHDAGLGYCDIKPDNVMLLPGGGLKLIDLGAVRSIGETSEDVYGTEGYMPPADGPDDGIPSVAMDIYAAGRTLAALILDFDITGEHRYSLPSSRTVNRIVGVAEAARLTDHKQGDLRFSLSGGEPLPAWLQVTELVDRKGEQVHVLHGSAPDGFTRLDVTVTRNSGSGILSLDCPMAFDSLRYLLERATHPDPEGRFHDTSDMASHCAGVLRELLGAEGLPSPGASQSFAQSEHDISFSGSASFDWHILPPPLLNKNDNAFESVIRALDERSDDVRLANLELVVREGGGAASWGIDPYLRYVETFLALPPAMGLRSVDKACHFLRLAVQVSPWDWRPAWMEGKYWVYANSMSQAAACFSYVEHLLPGEAFPKVALAGALEALGNPLDALLLHNAALRITPGLEVSRLGRLRCLFMTQDLTFDTALRDFLKAWPAMRPGWVSFIRQQAVFGTVLDKSVCDWMLVHMVALDGVPVDKVTLDGMVTRMKKFGIATLKMPLGHTPVSISKLDVILASLNERHRPAAQEPRSLVSSLSKAVGGMIPLPWKTIKK